MHTPTPAWRILVRSKRFWLCLVVLLFGAVLDSIHGAAIQRYFPDREPIPDTLFTLLPYLPWTQYFSDLANVFSCILLAVFLFPRRWRELPFTFAVLGLGYFLRSVIILLNPIGGPLGNYVHYGLTTIHQYGQFPSGHTFLVVAVYLLIQPDQLRLKRLALLSVLIEVASLLLSHGHYSLDIIGGIFLGYFAYHVLEGRRSWFVPKGLRGAADVPR